MMGAPAEKDERTDLSAGTAKPAGAEASSLGAGLLGGLLGGALYGLLLAHLAQRGLAPLPAASQLVYLALAAGGNALAGLAAAALGLILPSRAPGRPLPGAAWALLALALIELHLKLLELDLAALPHGLVLLCTFLGARRILGGLTPLLRRPCRAGVLAALDLAALLAFVARVAATEASDQGAPAWTVALWLPALLSLALGLGLVARRRSTRFAAAAAGVWGLVLAGLALRPTSGPPATAARPNVLIVTIDTLRADHLGCYGATDVETPALDAFAAEGALFEEATSPIPTTNPAHSSLFTGLDPGDHGVINNAPYAFFPEVRTLPELLEREGYRTAAFVSGYTLKRDLSRLFGRFQLFDDVFGFLPLVPSEWRDTALPRLAKGVAPYLGLRLRILDERFDRRAEDLVDAAEGWLARNGDGAFFLWLHFYDPHMPYDPPAEYARRYGLGERGEDWYGLGPDERTAATRDPRRIQRLRDRYKAEITYVDHELGRLFAYLDARGLRENTLVVVTSDHGESLGEHDYWFDHSYFLYDTTLRIPLMVRFPDGRDAGRRVSRPVRLIDVFPTVLAELGLEPPEGIDAVSLLPALNGKAEGPAPPAFSVTYDFRESRKKRLLSVRTGGWKYVRTSVQWDEFYRRSEREELYDLTSDPQELHDLSAERPAELERLRALGADRWRRWTHDAGHVTRELSPRERRRLEDLGYF